MTRLLCSMLILLLASHSKMATAFGWRSRTTAAAAFRRQHTTSKLFLSSSSTLLLDDMWHIQGLVEHGFGRGSRKLGVPTANLALPTTLDDDLLLPPHGVYFGWAALSNTNQTCTTTTKSIHPAVVNIGQAPTFAGAQPNQPLVEAHFISTNDDDDNNEIPNDFYGHFVSLELVGFLRKEQKFESLDALVEQIQADIQAATQALQSTPPFCDVAKKVFLEGNAKTAATTTASAVWSQSMTEYLHKE